MLIIPRSGLLAGLGDLFLFQNRRIFVRLNLQDGFRFVHISFGSTFKFKLLAQLPVDQLPHSVVSSFIPTLRLFAAFAYVINRFVSITT